MSKFLFLAIAVFVAQSAQAATKWTLNCAVTSKVAKVPAQVAKYRITKEAFLNPNPTPGHKWNKRYAVEVFFKALPNKAYTYKLVHGGSGDEDYNEFKLSATDAQSSRINVQGAYIQNNFEWATLVDRDGYGFADCRN